MNMYESLTAYQRMMVLALWQMHISLCATWKDQPQATVTFVRPDFWSIALGVNWQSYHYALLIDLINKGWLQKRIIAKLVYYGLTDDAYEVMRETMSKAGEYVDFARNLGILD